LRIAHEAAWYLVRLRARVRVRVRVRASVRVRVRASVRVRARARSRGRGGAMVRVAARARARARARVRRGGAVHEGGDDADDDGRPRVHGGAACGDADEAAEEGVASVADIVHAGATERRRHAPGSGSGSG